jgi:acetyl esterase/lipase
MIKKTKRKIMKGLESKLILYSFMSVSILISGISAQAQNHVLPLWEGQIPNFKDTGELEKRDTSGIVSISNVQIPEIEVYLPAKQNANGDAVVICPGGGYWILAYDWEGTDIAKFFNSRGIAGIVLKYRLPTGSGNIEPRLSPLLDAQRAMRLVRYNAKSWNINQDRIGIMGFSAGGHLASTLSTHFDTGNPDAEDPIDRLSCRPDFSILMYPVISFRQEISHPGSANALLGNNPDPEMIKYYSNELQVTENTPPAILIHSGDDDVVPVQNSIAYYNALRSKNIPGSLLIYPYGGHGYSLAIGKGYLSTWPDRVIEWMESMKNK